MEPTKEILQAEVHISDAPMQAIRDYGSKMLKDMLEAFPEKKAVCLIVAEKPSDTTI